MNIGLGEHTRRRILVLTVVLWAVLLVTSTFTPAIAIQPASASTVDNLAAVPPPEYVANTTTITTVATQSASSHLTTITGQVQYRNQAGGLDPARQVQVKIRKDNIGPINNVIAKTQTNETGHFSVDIDVDSRESNLDGDDTLHLRIQAIARNPAVKVIRFGQNADTANGRQYTLDRAGTVERGQASANFDLTATSQRDRRVFQIANWSLEARRTTIAETSNNWTRKRVKVKYPAANDDNNQYKSPFNKIVIGSNDWANKRETVYHEYGHAVMGGLFDYSGWQIPNYKGSHCVWSNTGRITAWYEGFAEFYEAMTNGTHTTGNMDLDTYAWYADTRTTNASCPDASGGQFDYDGVEVEGAIANILWDLYDPANEPHDTIDGDLDTIFDAVDEKDNRAWGRIANNGRTRDIHDFFIQYTDNTGEYEALRKIYFEYGIIKPDRFEHDPTADQFLASCSIAGHPCDLLDGEVWSELAPNTSIDAGLHHGDTDFYRFDVLEEQRVTVTLNRTGGDADPALAVTTSNQQSATSLGTPVETGVNDSFTFTVRDSGTHYVWIGDENGTLDAVAEYTLSINASPQVDQTLEEDDTQSQATVLSPFRIDDHIFMAQHTAATARHDHDYFAINLTKGERIYNATLHDGPGLTLAFEDNTGQQLQAVPSGQAMNTTTEPGGWHYFNVSGDARIESYTLNVTTQRISQLYEDNDQRSAAADLEADLDLETRPVQTGTSRGTTQCSGGQDSNTAGGIPTGTPGTTTLCSRHDWRAGGSVAPGYAITDPDWYFVTMERDERINVTVPHEALGVELYHNGQQVAAASEGPGSSVTHYAQSPGRYEINVTGVDYVPVHDLFVWRFVAEGTDQYEPNDEQSTATSVTAATVGNYTETISLAKLAGNDEDYYAVDLQSGDTLNATLTHLETPGDVSLTLLEPDGSTTTGSDPRPQIGTTRTYSEEMKRATLTAQQSGIHYVVVSGSELTALKYNLTIRTHSDSAIDWSNPLLNSPQFGGLIDFGRIIQTIEFEVVDPQIPEIELPQQPVDTGGGECGLVDTEEETITVTIDAGQSTRIQQFREFALDYPNPCRIEALVTGPDSAEVDLYVTFDGSRPSQNNYQIAGTNPGSHESLVATRADGLRAGVPIRVMVEGYPIAGSYEVVVKKYGTGSS